MRPEEPKSVVGFRGRGSAAASPSPPAKVPGERCEHPQWGPRGEPLPPNGFPIFQVHCVASPAAFNGLSALGSYMQYNVE